MISATGPHPFVYGRPVRSGEFVGRKYELATVFDRLRKQESTAIVGAPHIGKSSVLAQIADDATQKRYLGATARRLTICSIDMHPISNDYNPQAFGDECLDPLQEKPGHTAIAAKLKRASDAVYSRRSLERLFTALAARHQCVVLLLDEFERLLTHREFSDPAFFALLRSLSTRTGGLSLVIASRLSLAEMNERGHDQLEPGQGELGSPFFNHFIEVRLRPFADAEVEELLVRGGEAISSEDREFIRQVAGCHPFLLQAMAGIMAGSRGPDRHAQVGEQFYDHVAFHFDDLWQSLDDRARTTAVILALVELHGRALGEAYAYKEIEKVDAFGPELRALAERGLAKRVDQGWSFDWRRLLLWRGESWTVGAQAFAWWIREVAIAGVREVPSYK